MSSESYINKLRQHVTKAQAAGDWERAYELDQELNDALARQGEKETNAGLAKQDEEYGRLAKVKEKADQERHQRELEDEARRIAEADAADAETASEERMHWRRWSGRSDPIRSACTSTTAKSARAGMWRAAGGAND